MVRVRTMGEVESETRGTQKTPPVGHYFPGRRLIMSRQSTAVHAPCRPLALLLALAAPLLWQRGAQGQPTVLQHESAASMFRGREFPTLSILRNGKVLAVGHITIDDRYAGV